jgi:quinol monooxygenase YgiN
MSKIALIVKTKTQPGKRAEVRRLYTDILGPRATANAAQELVIWCDDDADPDTFYLFEVYSDRASQQENGQAPWFFEYLQKVQALLAGMPEVMTGTPQWGKGVTV